MRGTGSRDCPSALPVARHCLNNSVCRFASWMCKVDEHRNGGEPPRAYVHRLALEKARAGLRARQAGDEYPVIVADTSVVIDDEVLGKPEDSDRALAMLQRLCGRCHQVYTAVAFAGGIERAALSVSRVEFRPLSEAEQRAYVRSEEPFGKAGGYAVQGLAGAFISRSYVSWDCPCMTPLCS